MELHLRSHRTYIPISEKPQKLFVTARLQPSGSVSTLRMTPSISIVVDTSGSMYQRGENGKSKMDTAIEVIGSIPFIPGFSHGAEISLIQFDSNASVLLAQSQLPKNAVEVMQSHATRLRNFNGGTMLNKGLLLALEELAKSTKGTNKTIIILTDGETGDEKACFDLTNQAIKSGIDFFCIGLGKEYNENFLTLLAEQTRGGIAHVTDDQFSTQALHDALSVRLRHAQRETIHNASIRVEVAKNATLSSISQVYPKCMTLPKKESQSWQLGAMAADDDPVFLLEFEIRSTEKNETSAVASISVNFRDEMTQKDELLTQNVFIGQSADPMMSRKIDDSVMHYVRQRNIASLVDNASQLSRQGNIGQAGVKLASARRITNMIGHVVLDRKLAQAQQDLEQGEEIRTSLRKDLKVTSRMGTTSIFSSKHDV